MSEVEQTIQERCQEILPAIQAGAEGKVIQAMDPLRGGAWIDCTKPSRLKYRIKPEPKYRPFTLVEALKVGNLRVLRKDGASSEQLYGVRVTVDGEVFVVGQNRFLTFPHLLEHYEFYSSGAPCGVLIEG